MPKHNRRRFLLFTSLVISGQAGCGTILYPERRGQTSGQIDWGVVALDGVGCLLFLLPGLIAFAIDFSQGTIYLPSDSVGEVEPSTLSKVTIPVAAITRGRVEEIVSSHAGRDVSLEPGTFRTARLASLDRFWQLKDRLSAAVSHG
jgi:hypothetical protein